MGLEKIKEEILHKADATEKEIISGAEAKVKDIRNNTDEQIRQLESEAAKKLEAESKSLESMENSLASMEAQRMLFEAKKGLMDNVYSEAFGRIRSMPAKDREETIKKLLEMAKREIAVHVVFANEKDKKYCENDVEVKETEIDGIICETKDGNMRVNLTFDTLFADLREKTAKEVSNILFG